MNLLSSIGKGWRALVLVGIITGACGAAGHFASELEAGTAAERSGIVAVAFPASAKYVFYVSNDGNDRWSGTRPAPAGGDGPFASIERARDAIRSLKAAERLDGPVDVQIRGGTYQLKSPLVLTPGDSGSSRAPITYEAYPGETPVLSGGQRITGWRKLGNEADSVSPAARGEVFVADVSPGWRFNDLWLSGRSLSRSAAPNTDDWRQWPRATPARGVINGFYFAPGTVERYADITSAEVNMVPFIGSHPVNFLAPIANLDVRSGTLVFADAAKDSVLKKYRNGDYFRIENVLGAIVRPGQWSVNADKGKVYCWPPANTDLNTAEVVAPRLLEAIELRGFEGRGELVRFVRIRGLTISHVDRRRLDQPFPPGPQLRLIKFETQDAAVLLSGVEDCSIEQCRITNVGGMGVRATYYAQRIRILNNEISDCGGSAIAFEGYEAGTHDVNRDNLIAGNSLHHCAQSSWRGSGVTLLQAGHVTVQDNKIYDLPFCGILVSGYPVSWVRTHRLDPKGKMASPEGVVEPPNPSLALRQGEIGDDPLTIDSVKKFIPGSVLIKDNVVSDMMKILDDGGGIYAGWSHHTVIQHNRVYRSHREMSYGIYLDAEQLDTTVRDNVVYDCPEVASPRIGAALYLNNTGRNQVRNNILALSSRLFQFWASDGGQVATQNIFLFKGIPGDAVLTAAHKGRMNLRDLGVIKEPRSPLSEILEMPIFDPAYQGFGNNMGPSTMDYNIYWSTGGYAAIQPFVDHWRKGGWDQHSIVSDPLFVNAEAGDFRLRAGSPAPGVGFHPFEIPAAN
ncbi:MAG: right-handed parallel beta-helix repeat-containing protein [Candidatus Binatus sp.]|uniref:right-handed parallel beta-helix repeat-containing protein n=1 Tax=Candidatus Binatus sp. TaxID=2811406 RepID=UPI002723BA39|nr:right-handed parallel beta-helix repeat-containing protein [Candidatus Binatus sp.]MDO8432776.1 right-handed parallel beta-helix repeat-containing protein [Candidatus Binatus sp.]